MRIVWHLIGRRAGEYQQLRDSEAREAVAAGVAQYADDGTPLRYPETHPDVVAGHVAAPVRTRDAVPETKSTGETRDAATGDGARKRTKGKRYKDRAMTAESRG